MPDGETLLWQGRPHAGTLLVRAFHLRLVAAYFAVLIAASAVSAARHGATLHAEYLVVLHRAALAAILFALAGLYAWAVQRSTTYSITSQRVVMSLGIALPVSLNIPFSGIDAAGLRLHRGGAGDITLRLLPGKGLSYFLLWPHARPWHLARAEPMLRCVANAEQASRILAAALAEHASAHPAAAATKRHAVRLVTAPGRGAMVRA